MRFKTWWCAFAVMMCLTPCGLYAKNKKAVETTNRLATIIQVIPTEKTMDTTSKVKGVFSKSSRTVNLKCVLVNQSQKDIRAVRGTLKFTTYFGDPIAELTVELVTPLPPGQKIPTSWKIKRERFSSDDAFKVFADTPLQKMRMVWVPSVAVLADGSKLLP
jgi:hypothetical protein